MLEQRHPFTRRQRASAWAKAPLIMAGTPSMDTSRNCGRAQTTWNGLNSGKRWDVAQCALREEGGRAGGGQQRRGQCHRAHQHTKGMRHKPKGLLDQDCRSHRPHGLAYQQARIRETRPEQPATPTTKATRNTRGQGGGGEDSKTALVPPRTACASSTETGQCTCQCSSGTPPPRTSLSARHLLREHWGYGRRQASSTVYTRARLRRQPGRPHISGATEWVSA